METLYWLSRLDGIRIITIIFLIISFFILFFLAANYLITENDNQTDISQQPKAIAKKLFVKSLKYTIPLILFNTFAIIFIPSASTAYEIWGVGKTMDYVRKKPTVKKLPHDCQFALKECAENMKMKNN